MARRRTVQQVCGLLCGLCGLFFAILFLSKLKQKLFKHKSNGRGFQTKHRVAFIESILER